MRNYTIPFFLFLLCGCELTVNVDVPRDKESLVVNALFAADSLWAVQVSYDRYILDKSPFKSVEDAEVVIYDESGPVETLKLNSKKVYRAATNKPVPGKRYEIRVSSPGHDPVSAVGYIPRATEIVSVKTRDTSIDDDHYTVFDITIKDDPSIENYYRVFVSGETYSAGPSKTPQVYYSRFYVESDDPLWDDENNRSEGGILIKDAVFNGRETKLSVRLQVGPYGSAAGAKRINVQTLSREAYDYLLKSQVQLNTSGDPFAQPVNVFNNIEGGFGIFAGYNQSIGYVEDNTAPVITSISPMSGYFDDEIIIEGANFIENYKPTVVFNGGDYYSHATVIESSPTRIRVQVPDGAITGPITIFSGGQMVISKEDFVVLGPPIPIITNITPMSARINEEVIIEGSNLGKFGAYRQVFFSGVGYSADILESSSTRIKTRVPYGAVTGPITVKVFEQTAVSKDDFVVTN